MINDIYTIYFSFRKPHGNSSERNFLQILQLLTNSLTLVAQTLKVMQKLTKITVPLFTHIPNNLYNCLQVPSNGVKEFYLYSK